MSKTVCLYFQVHQPWRLSPISLLHPDKNPKDLFLGESPHTNQEVFEKVARKSYLPMTDLLLKLCKQYKTFRCSFSLSGVFIQQCESFGLIGEEVLNNFKRLNQTGQVEFLAETYYHSLSFLYSKLEFCEQIQMHEKAMKKHFGVKPNVFRHTELIYNNDLASAIQLLGYNGIITEGWHTAIEGDTPNYIHKAHLKDISKTDARIYKKFRRKHSFIKSLYQKKDLPVLAKNYELSDDMAFRFGDKNWDHHPLHSETYAQWIEESPGDTVNLFMDFETFGEHQWEDTGIFKFFEALPGELWKRKIRFLTPSETIDAYDMYGTYETETWVSWADEARDISAWLDNDLQKSAYKKLLKLEEILHPLRRSKKKEAQNIWENFRKLQTSDHLYYMSTKYWADGDVHTYFSPYESPYDAYINFMNAVDQMAQRIKKFQSQ